MDIRHSGKIKCGLINIQSVGNKTVEIRDLINYSKFDILMLTETWLGSYDTAKINEMTPNTHSFLHVPRRDRVGEESAFFSLTLLHILRLKNVTLL